MSLNKGMEIRNHEVGVNNKGSENHSIIPTPEEAEFIAEISEVREVKKGTLLQKAGKLATATYHVYAGCVREYCIKDDEEITTEFYTTGDNMCDDASKLNKVPSLLNWECVVDSTVCVVPFDKELELFKRFPRLESLCRIEAEKKLGDYKQAVNTYHSSSPEERYHHLLATRPAIFELVPLYHIASYLGVKPESLSRIRNRMRNAARPI